MNYRTSRQIRRRSDLLLPSRLLELDGAEEDRTGVQSVFDGPPPQIGVYPTAEAEIEAVAAWIAETISDGVLPEEIGVLVRTVEEFERAERAIEAAGQRSRTLVRGRLPEPGEVTLATMHAAKGLEFLRCRRHGL